MAKQLDPKDPTPWFYDAILKQTQNRPVEALQDLQKSIELNDNRAVYRSRLLLDEDAAARSASLAELYDELGFQKLPAVEATKSLAADPSSFSAHRLLAESYSGVPRYEVARASEALQAQLRQPITRIWPVQLADEKLIIPSNSTVPATSVGGPTRVGINEYTPLFTSEGMSLQLDGVGGNRDTVGDQVIVAGLFDRISFSLAQYAFRTDGFSEQNDLKKEAYDAFIEGQLAYGTTVQAEFRKSNTDRGDILTNFDALFALPVRTHQSTESQRVGLRQQLGSNADLLLSAASEQVDAQDQTFGVTTDLTSRNSAFELQSAIRWDVADIVLGAGHFDGRQDFAVFGSPSPRFTEYQTNAYGYVNVRVIPRTLGVTLGLSASFPHEADIPDRDPLSPKLGVLWNPTQTTLVRAAFARTISRRLVSNQTLEPTQIAGFNQLFADFAGAVARLYGLGVDQALGSRTYVGLEGTTRDLTIPVFRFVGSGPEDVNWKEDTLRAYWYWTPTQRLAVSAEYRFEHYDRPDTFTGLEAFKDVGIQRVPLGLGMYLTNGLSFHLTQTYIRENGTFLVAIGAPSVTIDEDFWLTDLSLRYRLPRRMGFISLEARNLFNRKTRFQDTDPLNPSIAQGQLLLGRIQLVF